MQKSRKTKKEKVRSTQRQQQSAFKVKEEWLKTDSKKSRPSNEVSVSGTKFFRQDLTKTFVLTMLVLALELALWQYLSRH